MWSSRRHLLLGSFAFLGGCGFAPIYLDGTSRLDGAMAVAPISGMMGFEMRRRLTERLGHADGGRYALSATISTNERALAITPRAEITRYNLTGTARYTVRDTQAGNVATRGSVRAFSAYSANDAAFATRAAERDAQLRLAVALADQIATRLLASAGDWQK